MVRENRRRYIVIHVKSPEGVGKGLLINLIRGRTRELPEEDFRRMKPWFVYYRSGWAIVRTWHRGSSDLSRMIEEMNGMVLREGPLQIHVVGVSGTLRSAFYKHVPEPVREELHYREEKEQ